LIKEISSPNIEQGLETRSFYNRSAVMKAMIEVVGKERAIADR